jgi:hypothetical protein
MATPVGRWPTAMGAETAPDRMWILDTVPSTLFVT